jgi:hypothetical protein
MRLLLLALIFFGLSCQTATSPSAPFPKREHGLIKDLKFGHKRHNSREGAPESCIGCHTSRFGKPSMALCTSCHARAEVVKSENVIENCGVCHEKLTDKTVRPEYPWHYGSGKHQRYAEQPVLYCAYCHDKDPAIFAVKPRYGPREACVGCHQSEGLGVPGGI